RIVGVADPRTYYRENLAKIHSVPRENVFKTWEDMAKRDKFADAVIISTQDNMHLDPSLAFAAKKYDILLEKPIAPDPQSCKKIVKSVKQANIIFGVCHVLRYTRYTMTLKKLIDDGVIGDVVCLQHSEPVGYWHQAHSYVRGNWRNEKDSSSMLLAKSCHDLDWIRHIMGKKFVAVSSFGSLKHFRKEEKPKGAAKRCLTCRIESTCPYSAKKIYLTDRVLKGHIGWPTNVLTTDLTVEGITKALKTGPYGRCVYECDNDVVDNQVVNMEFEGGRTATFIMTAFSHGPRSTTIHGTKGQLKGDSSNIIHFDFLTDKTTTYDTKAPDGSILGGHGGGDGGVMEAFIDAVRTRDQSKILSGPDESLETHLAVFAAEQARHRSSVVKIK
ncbi:MAG: Gfo/Idh/MocA family oxidoreductase, partial [Lentisphaerae bacterium]|nr:Gfo/Idh/MocA family oxidoreductase [Lentisphaerota bacterium]